MGRPRKQPRRIMTFNLNQPLAEAIDDLPVKNRSEWANKVLQGVLDGRQEANELKSEVGRQEIEIEAEEQLLNNLLKDPKRLALMLRSSLIEGGFEGYKPKGRYPLTELLFEAVAGRPNNRLFPPPNAGDENAGVR